MRKGITHKTMIVCMSCTLLKSTSSSLPTCWCCFSRPAGAPCHLFEPKISALQPLYPEVQFAKVDVEDAVELADSFAISTLPTVVLVKQGAEVHRIVGVAHKRPSRPVSQAIRRYLLGQQQDNAGASS